MDRERWIRIDELFRLALSREPSKRAAFLSEACAGDASLRSDVESLLAADLRAGSFLERGPPDGAIRLEPEHSFGAYQITGLIAAGGMGEVYRAVDKRLAREVALKVFPPWRASNSQDAILAQRFETEALVTATVQHPAVVPIYERGQLADGRPFYAMKLVSGQSLRELIDQRRTVASRIALLPNLIAVAEALAYSHSQRVLHRDVKPSNIIIGEFGETILIDWGVAKDLTHHVQKFPTGGGLTSAERTAAGMIIGTLAYMPPEQAKGEGVDERADVFSLGATLYHLIAGRAPYEGDTAAILPRVSQGDYQALGEGQSDVPGELAAIVNKAMAKEPLHRYPTARELAEDLRRFLTGQLVLSHHYSARELAARWAKRYRPLLLASAAFLLLGAVGAAIGLHRIVSERDRANREADASNRVSQFMTEMFKVSDPSEARGNKVTAREILDKASTQIEAGLQRDPVVQANLMQAMATVYESLGLYAKARPLAEKAVERRQQLLGATHLDTLRSMTTLAMIERDQGKYDAAAARQRGVLEARRRLLGPENPETLVSTSDLALIESRQGHYAEAERLHRQVLEIRRRLLSPEHPDTLRAIGFLATVQKARGDYAAAEKNNRELLEIRRRVLGADHPDTLAAMGNLADVYHVEGREGEAEKIHREALEIRRRVLGPEHPQTLASMVSVAVSASIQGHYAAGTELFEQVREIQRRVLGPEHPDTLISGHNVASNLQLEGRFIDARNLNRQLLEIRRRVLGPEHHHTLMSMSSLAENERILGNYVEAETLYRKFLDTGRRTLGPSHPDLFGPMRGLGALYLTTKRPAQAESIHREVLELSRRVLGPDHPGTLRTMDRLAEDETALGRYEEADKLYRETLEAQRRVFKRDTADIAETLIGMASLEARQGRGEAAEKHYSEALAMTERMFGPKHPYAADSLYGLGALALTRGDRAKALDYLQRALDQGLAISKRMKMRDDGALKPLRGDPLFEALVADVQKHAQAQ